MHPFTTLIAIAAPLPMDNVDTDAIIPKQFLTTVKRTGLAKGLFYDLRYDANHKKIEDFVLHRAPFDKAQILIGGMNFGCGSSREHAPWALLDFGIHCVIAPSFADIFYNNCFKNGILPVILPKEQVDALMRYAETGGKVTIDLPRQTVGTPEASYEFSVESFRKHCLLNGLDDIGLTLQKIESIDAFEARQRQDTPWLYGSA